MAARSSITVVLDGAPDMVFRKITDIARLPEWNAAMTKVVEAPAELEPGAEWVVEFHALGQRWRSRSRVEQLDAEAWRFAYRSWTDDGNPSYASWSWKVAEDPSGSRVTVAWELHPVTFWRRVLLVRIRARQLSRRELPDSLTALAAAAKAAEPRSNQGFV
jgi:uncharacterized protein YndB with AHSA1/START domain